MKNLIAYHSEGLPDNKCRVTDSNGREIVSGDAAEILVFIAKHSQDAFHVVYNLADFMKPIKEIMPGDIYKQLYNTERVRWGEFKLFYPEINGGLLGIDFKHREQISGNLYQEEKYEITLYDISRYFTGEACQSAQDIKGKGIELLTTLERMGLTPGKLTTPAAIYTECILSIIPYATYWNLPESSNDMMDMAGDYIREWRSVYKMGIFPHGKAKQFDLTSAYPSIIAGLPNMTGAEFYYSPDGTIPDNAEWGLVRANIDVKKDITFLVSDDGICRKGKRIDLISNEEIDYCIKTGHADIEPLEAWYFTLPVKRYIFDYSMRKLYQQRNGNGLQNRLAKAFAVCVWGKMQEFNKRTELPGDYCNYIYASMVASRCRLKVMQFIDDNNLHEDLVSVQVDGNVATKDIPGISTEKVFGEWRVNPDSEAIILNDNCQWIGDKHQLGITAGELIAEIKAHPARQSYKGVVISLLKHDREYKELPISGYDLLKKKYVSSPVKTQSDLLNPERIGVS